MQLLAFLALVLTGIFLYGIADTRRAKTRARPQGKYIFQNTDGDTAADVYGDLLLETGFTPAL